MEDNNIDIDNEQNHYASPSEKKIYKKNKDLNK